MPFVTNNIKAGSTRGLVKSAVNLNLSFLGESVEVLGTPILLSRCKWSNFVAPMFYLQFFDSNVLPVDDVTIPQVSTQLTGNNDELNFIDGPIVFPNGLIIAPSTMPGIFDERPMTSDLIVLIKYEIYNG